MFSNIFVKHRFGSKVLSTELHLFHRTLRNLLICEKGLLHTSPFHFANVRICGTKDTRLNYVKQQFQKQLDSTNQVQKILQRCCTTFNVNTNVKNNVILFKNDTPRYFLASTIFAVTHLITWAVTGYYAFTPHIFDIFFSDVDLKSFSQMYGSSILICSFALFAGLGGCGAVLLMAMRSVKYIILHKGGEQVSILTYSPFKKSAIVSAPVNKIYTRISRAEGKAYLPLKIRGRMFYYLVDTKGQFINGPLYDATVGTFH